MHKKPFFVHNNLGLVLEAGEGTTTLKPCWNIRGHKLLQANLNSPGARPSRIIIGNATGHYEFYHGHDGTQRTTYLSHYVVKVNGQRFALGLNRREAWEVFKANAGNNPGMTIHLETIYLGIQDNDHTEAQVWPNQQEA